MKWILRLVVVGLMLGGCNAKLKRHVGSIEDMSVKVRHQQVQPGVDLANLEGTETDEYPAGKRDPSHPAAHGAIEAFEQGFGMRLSSVMDTQKMAKRVRQKSLRLILAISDTCLLLRKPWCTKKNFGTFSNS